MSLTKNISNMENQKKQELEWLAGSDTGISSKTIFGAITQICVDYRDVPHDIADVGRCVRMLRKLPHLRPHLEMVIQRHPEWMPFIDCWMELERLYDECVKYESLTVGEKQKLQRKKHFIRPNDTAWNLIQELETASRYLKGMRIQNYSNSWANRPPICY